jgi:hypothetical protein
MIQIKQPRISKQISDMLASIITFKLFHRSVLISLNKKFNIYFILHINVLVIVFPIIIFCKTNLKICVKQKRYKNQKIIILILMYNKLNPMY